MRRGALLLAALHAVHARNATAPGAQGPPPRLIVELAGTAPVAAQHPSGETTPAAQTPSDTKSAPAKSELFGFDSFDKFISLMMLQNAALSLRPPIVPGLPMLPGLPGMSARNSLNPLGPIAPVTIEARATGAAESMIEPGALLPTSPLQGGGSNPPAPWWLLFRGMNP